MANDQKSAYNDYIKGPKTQIDAATKHIKEITAARKKYPNLAGYYGIELITEYTRIVNLYIDMSDASLEMLNLRNSTHLDNARKEFFKILQLMEELVGKDIDRSLSDNRDYLKKIDRINPQQLLVLIRGVHILFDKLVDKLGEGNKFKWQLVDLQVRIAAATKNFVNFNDIQKLKDPRVEFYNDRADLMTLAKRSLEEAAKQSRSKYENAPNRAAEDMVRSIDLLSALKRINVLFGENEEAEKNKITIDALKARLEAEEKKNEEKSKQKK